MNNYKKDFQQLIEGFNQINYNQDLTILTNQQVWKDDNDFANAFLDPSTYTTKRIDGNRQNNHPNQKLSYRTNMLKIYGNNVKTNLYPNGFNGALKDFS